MQKPIMTRLGMILVVSSVYLALPARGPAKDEGWETLKRVTLSRTYWVLDREGSCVNGEIVSITENAITIKHLEWGAGKSPKRQTVTIERPSVLRIADGLKVIDVVYSGKSSWADVQALEHIGSDERVLLVTQDGIQRKGKIIQVTGVGLKFEDRNESTGLPKSAVSQVYYVREKPVSAGVAYSAQEMGIIDPRLWPYLFHIPPKIRVLLYDSSSPEEDSPTPCKTGSRPLGTGNQQ